MKTLLSYTKSTKGNPFAFYKVEAEEVSGSRTATTVKLKIRISAKLEKSSDKVPRYEIIIGKIHAKIGGVDETENFSIDTGATVWSGTGVKTFEKIMTIRGMNISRTSIPMSFEVYNNTSSKCILKLRKIADMPISSPITKWKKAKMSMTASNITTKSAQAQVTGIPKVPYAVTAKWYIGSKLIMTETISANSSITQRNAFYGGLVPLTSYNLSVKFYYSSTLLRTVSTSINTPNENLNLSVLNSSASKTSLKATVGGLVASPNYTRTLKIYYKKSSERDWILAYNKTNTTTGLTKQIEKLMSSTQYDVKACVYNGTRLLKEVTKSATTSTDSHPEQTYILPTPRFGNVHQYFNGNDAGHVYCYVEYLLDLEAVNCTQTLRVSVNGGAWTNLTITDTRKDAYGIFKFDLPPGDDSMTVKFNYKTEISNGSNTNISSSTITLYGPFDWDTAKTQGGIFSITANEWNRLTDYVEYVGNCLNVGVDLDEVEQGDVVTADIYNAVQSAIFDVIGEKVAKSISYTNTPKNAGETILAGDINKLKTAINSAKGGGRT